MSNLGKALGNKVVTYGKYSSTQSGNPIGYTKGETVQDYRDLANSMSMGARSNYPRGLSPCFVAGINGDWEDDGFCPVSKMDIDECTCEDEFKAPQVTMSNPCNLVFGGSAPTANTIEGIACCVACGYATSDHNQAITN